MQRHVEVAPRGIDVRIREVHRIDGAVAEIPIEAAVATSHHRLVGIVDEVHHTTALAQHGDSRVSLEFGDGLWIHNDGVVQRHGVHTTVGGRHPHRKRVSAGIVELEHRVLRRGAVGHTRSPEIVILDEIPFEIGVRRGGIVLNTQVQRRTTRQIGIRNIDHGPLENIDVDGVGALARKSGLVAGGDDVHVILASGEHLDGIGGVTRVPKILRGLALRASLIVVGSQNSDVAVTNLVIVAQVRLGMSDDFHVVDGIVNTTQLIQHLDGISDLSGLVGDNRGTVRAGAFHPSTVQCHIVRPVLRKQCRVEGNLPTAQIAVIDGVTIHHLNAPCTVHRTANQVGERAIGVIDIGHLRHIRGIDTPIRHRGVVIDIVSWSILVALVGGIRPAVVPALSHRSRRATATGVVIRVPEKGIGITATIPSPFRGRNLTGTSGRTTIIFLHNGNILLIRTSQSNPNISDIRVFEIYSDEQNVIGRLNGGRRGETGERNRGDV